MQRSTSPTASLLVQELLPPRTIGEIAHHLTQLEVDAMASEIVLKQVAKMKTCAACSATLTRETRAVIRSKLRAHINTVKAKSVELQAQLDAKHADLKARRSPKPRKARAVRKGGRVNG